MVPILERELDLEKNSLKGLFKGKPNKITPKRTISFSPNKINFFSSLSGNIMYFTLLFFCIILINKQQKYLYKINSQTTDPINSINNTFSNKLSDPLIKVK